MSYVSGKKCLIPCLQASGYAAPYVSVHCGHGGDFHALGIWAAVRRDRFVDYFLRFFSFIGNSLPTFFVALLLMQFFR